MQGTASPTIRQLKNGAPEANGPRTIVRYSRHPGCPTLAVFTVGIPACVVVMWISNGPNFRLMRT